MHATALQHLQFALQLQEHQPNSWRSKPNWSLRMSSYFVIGLFGVPLLDYSQHSVAEQCMPNLTLLLRCNCRSTNTSPGGPTQSGTGLRQAILARSASQALAAKAAASALKTQTSTQSSLDYSSALSPKPSAALTPQTSLQLTPVSAMTPLHATHTYTPGSFAHSLSLSRGVQEEEEVGAEDLEVAGVTLQCTPPLAEGKLTCSAQFFAMERIMYK